MNLHSHTSDKIQSNPTKSEKPKRKERVFIIIFFLGLQTIVPAMGLTEANDGRQVCKFGVADSLRDGEASDGDSG